MKSENILNDIINEMNRMTVALDDTEPFIKWAVENALTVTCCDMCAIVLINLNNAAISYGFRKSCGNELKASFKNTVKTKLQDLSFFDSLNVYDLASYVSSDDPDERQMKDSAEMGQFVVKTLKHKETLIGYCIFAWTNGWEIASNKADLLSGYCDQLSPALNTIMGKAIIHNQSYLLEERKKSAEDERKKLSVIIDGMKEGLIIVDENNHIMTMNKSACEMLEFHNYTDARYAKEILADVLKYEQCADGHGEEDILITVPVVKTIHKSVSPIYDASKRMLGRALLLTDVTKEREFEQMKVDFVSIASHEFRTPITAIKEAISLVNEEMMGPLNDKQKKCLDIAMKDTERLADLVKDLFKISQIESGKIELKRSAIALAFVIREVVEKLRPKAEKKNIEIVHKIPQDIPGVFADPHQISSVLRNIMDNAIKFTPEGGRVTLDVGSRTLDVTPATSHVPRPTSHVVVSVTDTGPGITAEDQEKLFHKFSQLDSSIRRESTGAGLGLAIAKGIVEMHGGEIWIESEKGKGAAFKFTLPVYNSIEPR